MPKYSLVLERDDALLLIREPAVMNVFSMEYIDQAWNRACITLTLTEEDYMFLTLKYKIINSYEIPGALINA